MSAMKKKEQLWDATAGPDANGAPLADWWRRAAALIVDMAVLWIPMGLAFRDMDRLPRTMIYLVVATAYFAFLNGGGRGQTLGKMVWDIRVRDAATGAPLGVPKAAVRYLVPALLSVPLPILGMLIGLTDGLWPLWDRRRQALHDKIVGSVVVAAKPRIS
jgi:uncharacterized RDD family membrane protein YckC